MAKQNAPKKLTKTDFLRKVFDKTPELSHREANARWSKAGHPGQISSALFYQVRAKLGIVIEWAWEAAPTAKSAIPKPTKAVYQLKIILKDVKPLVWRRVLVPDCSLETLHPVIQGAMGWHNAHMYCFDIGGVAYTSSFGAVELDMKFAHLTNLSEVAEEKSKFRYTYDFGDDWRHEIVVEKVTMPEMPRKFPECLKGERSSPPEDIGGGWGYLDFTQALSDPKHQRHAELMVWAAEFAPEKFDLDAANKYLRGIKC